MVVVLHIISLDDEIPTMWKAVHSDVDSSCIRPFHKGVAFGIKNRIYILTQFFLEVLREDLEVYGEQNFTYFRSVTSSAPDLKIHTISSIFSMKKQPFKR